MSPFLNDDPLGVTSGRSRRDPLQIVGTGGQAQPLSAFFGGGGFAGGRDAAFTAASVTPDRARIFFPNMDTRSEVNERNRTELSRSARFFFNNDCFVRGILLSYARQMAYSMPVPNTPDEEWNTMARHAWRTLSGSAASFDRAGKYNFATMQIMLSLLSKKDGDSLTVPTISPDGRSRMMLYEGHQIGSGTRGTEADDWFDGVRVDRQGLALRYNILSGMSRDERGQILDASQAYLYAKYERARQPRGVSALAPLLDSGVDVREITNDMQRGLKARQLIGFYWTPRDTSSPYFNTQRKSLQNELKKAYGGDGDDPSDPADPTQSILPYEDVFSGGNMVQAEDMIPQVLESAQPHENEMAFLDWRLRMMARGMDMPPEAVWQLGSLNGNTQRWVGEELDEMLRAERVQTQAPWVDWAWFMTIGPEIASGRLREPKIPDADRDYIGWWSIKQVQPPRKSLDKGREGKLRIEEVKNFLLSRERYHGSQGADWQDETWQSLREIKKIHEALVDEFEFSDPIIEIILARLLSPDPGTTIGNLNPDHLAELDEAQRKQEEADLTIPDDEVPEDPES